MSHRIASHRTAPHRPAPHRTAPHRTASHRIALRRIALHHVITSMTADSVTINAMILPDMTWHSLAWPCLALPGLALDWHGMALSVMRVGVSLLVACQWHHPHKQDRNSARMAIAREAIPGRSDRLRFTRNVVHVCSLCVDSLLLHPLFACVASVVRCLCLHPCKSGGRQSTGEQRGA